MAQASRSTPIGDDGVPVGQPKEGNATMLAVEMLKEGKSSVKSGGKGKSGKCASKAGAHNGKKSSGTKKKT